MKKEFIFFTIIISFLMGCSSPVMIGEEPEEATALVGLYTLTPMDPLLVTLLGIPEEKQIDTVIDEKGTITLPYIQEPIQAADLSTSQLEREIQRIYIEGGIYRSITVNIQTSAKTYYMEGEINRPQEYPLSRRITLLQAIAAASGYTEYANKKSIIITRRGTIIRANAKELEKHPELDIPIEAGDRIKVDRSFY